MSINYLRSANSADGIYYNATVVNNTVETTQSAPDPQINFYDTRATNILDDVSDYKLSVEKVSINGGTKNIPLFIPEIVVPYTSGGKDTTIYTLTFCWECVSGGNTFAYQSTQNLIWVPENQSNFTQQPPVATDVQSDSDYYYLYDYQHWADIMNTALNAAYLSVKAQAAADTLTFGTKCPFFSFNNDTLTFSISEDVNSAVVPNGNGIADGPFDGLSSAAAGYETGEYSFIGMNTNLEGLINNLPTTYYGAGKAWITPTGGANLGVLQQYPENVIKCSFGAGLPINVMRHVAAHSNQALTVNTGCLVNPFTGDILTTNTDMYVIMSEYASSVQTLWSPCASIVLTTTTIPVVDEFISNPIPLGTTNLGTAQPTSNATAKILLEEPIPAEGIDYFYYEPLTPTYTNLTPSHNPLGSIDFQAWWRNRLTNKLVPLTLYNLGSCTVRFLFQKKELP